MAVIYAFGDSITYGAWDVSKSGWAARMRKLLDDIQEKNPQYYALFYNLGICGETTDCLVNRFEGETAVRSKEEDGERSVFILAYGANDVAFLVEEGRFKASKDRYKANLTNVIEKALRLTSDIILVNVLPVVESKNNLRNGKRRLNKDIAEYNTVLKDLAQRFKLQLVDVNSAFMKTDYLKLFNEEDGLHPNEKGHELIFESIRPVVLNTLGWN